MEVVTLFRCIDCGTEGEQSSRGRKRLRCESCRKLVPDRRTYAERKGRRPIGTCEACGGEYRQQHRGQRWCSMACGNKGKRTVPAEGLSPEARERQRLYWQEKNRRRRAAKRGGASEPYTLAEIALRDDFNCGLCGKSVPMAVKVPEPLAPTIDHIVPISKGGDDTRANVQLAHFVCNSRKGPRELTS